VILLLAAAAEAAQYRRLDLADGRVITVQYEGADAGGLRVLTPQGTMRLPFEAVTQLTPVDAVAYEANGPLRVLVLPFVAGAPDAETQATLSARVMREEFARVPATRVYTLVDMAAYAPPATAEALARCGADADCLRARVAAYEVELVVSGTVTADGTTRLVGVYPSAPGARADAEVRIAGNPEVQYTFARRGAYALLGVDLPPDVQVVAEVPVADPTVVVPGPLPNPVDLPPEPTRGQRSVPAALVAVPLPGVTAFAGGQVGKGLLATALVVPATAGIVAGAGASTTRPAELIGISVLSWWGLCAVSNVAWMPSVTPTDGGATVNLGGRF